MTAINEHFQRSFTLLFNMKQTQSSSFNNQNDDDDGDGDVNNNAGTATKSSLNPNGSNLYGQNENKNIDGMLIIKCQSSSSI